MYKILKIINNSLFIKQLKKKKLQIYYSHIKMFQYKILKSIKKSKKKKNKFL